LRLEYGPPPPGRGPARSQAPAPQRTSPAQPAPAEDGSARNAFGGLLLFGGGSLLLVLLLWALTSYVGGTQGQGLVKVHAAKDWQDTGRTLEVGEQFTIEYITGKWAPWPNYFLDGEGCTDPSVCSQDPRQQANVCCMAHAGLIGRVGNGTAFAVGNAATVTALQSGALFLRMNDVVQGDNSGSLTVRIGLTSAEVSGASQGQEGTAAADPIAPQAASEATGLGVTPGTYRINKPIARWHDGSSKATTFTISVATIEVSQDGVMTVHVEYRNFSEYPQTFVCGAAAREYKQIYITSSGDETIEPVATFCGDHSGQPFTVPARGTVASWARFDTDADLTKPFSFNWYPSSASGGSVTIRRLLRA
jgi:hypothetical protein